MNKVILLGRLTKEPDVKYTQSENMLAIARYTLAVDRRFKKEGQPSADFINCVAFGKSAEFAEKYMTKGRLFGIIGRIQNRNYENDKKEKVYVTEIVVDEQYFADSKKDDKKDLSELLKEDNDKLKELDDIDLPF
ncbi:MAG: single-stranded DNA-binding protein [Methanosphaera sp.]|nr:single-stranded DNA-binding protein [Methanosphaera sp.]